MVVDSGKAFSEDKYVELRLGQCLMRNCGPTIRCNTIRLDWDGKNYLPEREPYSTLGTYRNLSNLGVVFGMYYQMEMLQSSALYQKVLPAEDGYPTIEEAGQANAFKIRKEDTLPYVTMKKGDHFRVRLNAAMPWMKQVGSSTKKTD